MLSKDALRWLGAALCTLVCVGCPCAIAWLGNTYGFDRLACDDDYQAWPSVAVDVLFCTAAVGTVAAAVLLRRWWWLAVLLLVPLLCVTGALAFTCGLWIDGTYF